MRAAKAGGPDMAAAPTSRAAQALRRGDHLRRLAPWAHCPPAPPLHLGDGPANAVDRAWWHHLAAGAPRSRAVAPRRLRLLRFWSRCPRLAVGRHAERQGPPLGAVPGLLGEDQEAASPRLTKPSVSAPSPGGTRHGDSPRSSPGSPLIRLRALPRHRGDQTQFDPDSLAASVAPPHSGYDGCSAGSPRKEDHRTQAL